MQYRDRKGNQLTSEVYGALLRDDVNFAYKTVAKSFDLPNDVMVSTVWLGIEHVGPGKHNIFETCVFGGELDQDINRYDTEDDAITGHLAMVKRVRLAEKGELEDLGERDAVTETKTKEITDGTE